MRVKKSADGFGAVIVELLNYASVIERKWTKPRGLLCSQHFAELSQNSFEADVTLGKRILLNLFFSFVYILAAGLFGVSLMVIHPVINFLAIILSRGLM